MGGEFYKANKVEAFVGIRRDDLDPLLPAGVAREFADVLDANTQLEPLHVALVDAGYNATNTPRVLVLEALHVQVDGGVNEIARATCVLACGRDATAMAAGTTDRRAVAAVHLIEQYLGRFVPTRVFVRRLTTATGDTAADFGDLLPEDGEWELLFQGLSTGPTRRGTPDAAAFVLHLVHVTGGLTFSSSLSGTVAAGTQMPYNLSPFIYQPGVAPPAGYGWSTPAGMVAATLANGPALYTDFWGYNVPARTAADPAAPRSAPGRTTPAAGGLKKFLENLAAQDQFDWVSFSRADTNGTLCPGVGRRANDRALAALGAVEPFGAGTAVENWNAVEAAVRPAAASGVAVDRAAVIRAVGPARYAALGYRYAVPIAFYLNQSRLGPAGVAGSMAHDIAAATFHELAPASFWDLIATRYAPRYQLAFAPTAAGGVVVPFQPLLDKYWQTVYASEVFSWDDDVRTPVPVRGAVLVAARRSDAGFPAAGTQGADPTGALAYATGDAAFDSCEDGVFIYRDMPTWLQTAFRNPPVFAPATLGGVRASAAVPWSTAPRAAQAVDEVVRNIPAAAGLSRQAAYQAVGVSPTAPVAPSEATRSTANRMARAVFQQARTQSRTAYVTGRFRTDVAPGSLLRLELPADRYVKRDLAGGRDTVLYGIVLRVTLSVDAERRSAATAFQIGFVRTEGEARVGATLHATGHPFWATVTLGHPWCDSLAMRRLLGTRADINFQPPNPL